MAIGATRSLTAGTTERFGRMRARNKASRELRARQQEKRKAVRELAAAKEQRRAQRIQRAQTTANLVSGIHFAAVEQTAGLFAITMQQVQQRAVSRVNEVV